MRTMTLRGGPLRAVHVFTPALVERLKTKEHQPVMAVRCETSNYCQMKLCYHVQIDGPSEMKEIFDSPLPGTDGRGVAILFTRSPITISYGEKLVTINTRDKKPDEVYNKIRKYITEGSI